MSGNWEMYALQTEEESGESQFASSLEIDSSHNLTIANYHGYRVTHSEQPFPYAVRIANSRNLRFRNVHVDSNSSIAVWDGAGVCRQGVRPNKVPFANAIVDETQHLQIRDREFTALDLTDGPPRPAAPERTEVRKLATGFFNASGAATDGMGQLYFVDTRFQRIYRWNQQVGTAEVVRDAPLAPADGGTLYVLSEHSLMRLTPLREHVV